MSIYDADGKSLDPEDPGGINPLHPTYLNDPMYRQYLRRWLRTRTSEETETPGAAPPA